VIASCFSLGQTELFEKRIFENENFNLPYRLCIPENMDSCMQYPLVLYLHGAGERGNDNEITLKHGVLNFVSEENRQSYPCFIVVPQCPPKFRWVEVDWDLPSHTIPHEISVPLYQTMLLLDTLIEYFPIDTNRIFVTGLSMGGFGTWDLISRYPDFFAAAVPVCGGADTSFAQKLTHIPIWTFHGEQDKIVLPSRSIDMVNLINNKGGSARLTLYPSTGHNAWVKAYENPKMMMWLFSQTRQKVFYE